MKIRFSVVEEFLDELHHEQKEVEDSVVRLTYRYEQSKEVPFLFYMSVVAGFMVRGKLIELHQLCGDVLKEPPATEGNARTKAKAEHIAKQIENYLTTLNRDGFAFALRRGVFEA